MKRETYRKCRKLYLEWCKMERASYHFSKRHNLPYYGQLPLVQAQWRLLNIRKQYYRRKRIMNIIRNVFIIFVLACAVTVMQGCTPIAMMKIAASDDPIDTQEQKDACESGISEMEEHYHKTPKLVKHSSKVVCK